MRIGFVSFSWDGGFDGQFAVAHMKAAIALLSRYGEVIAPAAPIASVAEARKVAEMLEAGHIDALILQQGTFCSAEPLPVVVERVTVPTAIWAVNEPYNGGPVVANSLVGLQLMGSVLSNLDHPYTYFYGDADEPECMREIDIFLKAAGAVAQLKRSRIGLVGSRAPGFFLMGADDMGLRRQIGPEIIHIDLSDLFGGPEPSPAELEAARTEFLRKVANAAELPAESLYKLARSLVRLRQLVKEKDLTAFALKDWPEFDPCYGISAESVLSFLTSEGIVAGCEGDLNGTITNLMLKELTGGGLTFLTDLVQIDRKQNTGILWHAGVAPLEMAADGQEIRFASKGSIQTKLEFVLKPGRITIARLGTLKGRYRLLVTTAEALPSPLMVRGAMVQVKFDAPARELLDTMILDGWEHHVSMVYGDVADELAEVADQLGIELVRL